MGPYNKELDSLLTGSWLHALQAGSLLAGLELDNLFHVAGTWIFCVNDIAVVTVCFKLMLYNYLETNSSSLEL